MNIVHLLRSLIALKSQNDMEQPYYASERDKVRAEWVTKLEENQWVLEMKVLLFAYDHLSKPRRREFRHWWRDCVMQDEEAVTFKQWAKGIRRKKWNREEWCPWNLLNPPTVAETASKLIDLYKLDKLRRSSSI